MSQVQETDINEIVEQVTPPVVAETPVKVEIEPVNPPVEKPVADFEKAKQKAKQVVNAVKTDNAKIINDFINDFQKNYEGDPELKEKVSQEIEKVKAIANSGNTTTDMLLKILNDSVTLIEADKKKAELIKQEKIDIEKIVGYTEVLKRAEILRKDKYYNELWEKLEKDSPKLAFETFRNIISSIAPPSPNGGSTNPTIPTKPVSQEVKIARSINDCIGNVNYMV